MVGPACTKIYNDRITLYNTLYRIPDGNTVAFTQIWNDSSRNGIMLPCEFAKRIRFQSSKRKRTQLDLDDDKVEHLE